MSIEKTKTCVYYADLAPGWQDWQGMQPFFTAACYSLPELQPSNVRVKVVVEFPCVGGSALAVQEIAGKVEVGT